MGRIINDVVGLLSLALAMLMLKQKLPAPLGHLTTPVAQLPLNPDTPAQSQNTVTATAEIMQHWCHQL